MRVHWSSNSIPFDKIFVIDSSGVEWSQKKVKDMNISRGDTQGMTLMTNKDGIIQISAQERDDGNVGLLIRLVAKAEIDPDKVRIIEIPKDIMKKLK